MKSSGDIYVLIKSTKNRQIFNLTSENQYRKSQMIRLTRILDHIIDVRSYCKSGPTAIGSNVITNKYWKRNFTENRLDDFSYFQKNISNWEIVHEWKKSEIFDFSIEDEKSNVMKS